MGYTIEEVEGIGPKYAAKLAEAGIGNTDELLAKCGAKKGRDAVAAATGLSASQLLSWTNKADLMRISGIGSEFADLLEAAGVDTVKELRRRNAENLAVKVSEINAEKSLTRQTPSADRIGKWVAAAADLEPAVSH
ncbi:MAG: putative flap endonuclease-1-like 5' DNA nuclease [Myxococcota bacterium]|jgi:predicted flap endonuclease-1-like 5' DNA nuclease